MKNWKSIISASFPTFCDICCRCRHHFPAGRPRKPLLPPATRYALDRAPGARPAVASRCPILLPRLGSVLLDLADHRLAERAFGGAVPPVAVARKNANTKVMTFSLLDDAGTRSPSVVDGCGSAISMVCGVLRVRGSTHGRNAPRSTALNATSISASIASRR